MLRVLILHEDKRGPGEGGGAESLLRDTMQSLERLGHEVAWWSGQNTIRQEIARFQPDVCHAMTLHNFVGFEPMLWLQKQRIPHIWSLMDYWPFCGERMLLTEGDKSCTAVAAVCDGKCTGHRAPEEYLQVVNGSPIVALNRYTAEIYERNGIGVAGVVPLGVDTDFFRPEREKRDGIKIVTTSAWPQWPTKGMHILKAALRKARMGAKLVTGVSRERVRDELQKASIFIFPSCYQETWGLCLTEAMACGCACISSDVAGPRAQIKDGATGLLVPPRDSDALASAIRWLLDHPTKREDMGRRARAWAESEASLEAMGEKWVAMYRRVMDGPRGDEQSRRSPAAHGRRYGGRGVDR